MEMMYNTEINNATLYTNTTTLPMTTTPNHELNIPEWAGYIAAAIAAVGFGSNFIPVKKFETGDGLFFQWVFCVALWIPSVVLHAARGFPRFWPLAMLGGFLWCSGNILCVPIIQCVGMAMGLLVWGTANMLMGWASGRFGWFGLDPETPDNLTYNYLGVFLCLTSAIIVSLIKPHIEDPEPVILRRDEETETDPLIPNDVTMAPPTGSVNKRTNYNSISESHPEVEEHADMSSLAHHLSPKMQKIVGLIMCVIAGSFFGLNFAPVIYVKNRYPQWYNSCTEDPCYSRVSQSDIDYVFPHFTGAVLTSTVYFLVYCIVKRNKPRVYPRVILPAFGSGVIWSISDISFFLANQTLSESVSFPIINAGPGVVAALWGVFLFKEIQGRRNLLILATAFCFTVAGCVFSGLSKKS